MVSYLGTKEGRRLAYRQTSGSKATTGPGIVFLGGFKSDMEGTKAVHLETWCKAHGRAFLRFDYSGHGSSSGAFTDGAIGDWAQDAQAVIETLTDGPQLLIGSSMGGWISLLMSQRIPDRIAGLVTIAAAPDFTEEFLNSLTTSQKAELDAGQVALPSDYGEPYIFTKRLIDDGRDNLVLNAPLHLPMPVRFLQGTDDADVDMSTALRLIDHAEGPDMRLVLLKGGDHRFSDPDALQLIEDSTNDVLRRLS